jgi:hypothetical protein
VNVYVDYLKPKMVKHEKYRTNYKLVWEEATFKGRMYSYLFLMIFQIDPPFQEQIYATQYLNYNFYDSKWHINYSTCSLRICEKQIRELSQDNFLDD